MSAIRVCFFIISLILASTQAEAQSIIILDVDASNFPNVSARLFVLDSNLVPIINLDVSDFEVTENGEDRIETYLYCPETKRKDVSTVLTIDVSESMIGERLAMAKKAAATWIKAMPGGSECAITSFNDHNDLVQDFTSIKSLLYDAARYLHASGGTSFNAGFIDPAAESFLIAERGKNKKITVFLSDGYSSGSEAAIIKKAKSLQTVVYCVTIGSPTPRILRNIAKQTGGEYFEDIFSEEQIIEIYKRISLVSMEYSPCMLKWISEMDCQRNIRVKISVPLLNVSSEVDYIIPIDFLPSLEFSERFLSFFGVVPNNNEVKEARIMARNRSVYIENITLDNPEFSIIDYGGDPPPFILEPQKPRTLKIEFLPKDSSIKFCRIEFINNGCTGRYMFAAGGFYNYPIGDKPTIRLLHPNGGEVFTVDSDRAVTWEGVLPWDVVRLDYSTNNGEKWIRTCDTVTGLAHNWTIPNTPSDECLMSVKQLVPNDMIAAATLDGHNGYVIAVSWNKYGNFLASGGADGHILVWDYLTGDTISNLTASPDNVESMAWSPEGDYIISGAQSGAILLWDPWNRIIINRYEEHTKPVCQICWSADGQLFASASEDGTAKVWSIDGGPSKTTFLKHEDGILSIAWSPIDNIIASGGDLLDGKIRIWDALSGRQIISINNNAPVEALAWDNLGVRVAAAGWNNVNVWNFFSGAIERVLEGHTQYVASLAWNFDGTRLASGALDSSVFIWDPNSGVDLYKFKRQKHIISCLAWRPESFILASGSNDRSVVVWDAENLIVQEDVSDSLWSIVAPDIRSCDVDCGEVAVNNSRDTLVEEFIINNGPVPVRIDSLFITNGDAGDFSVLSGKLPLTLNGGEAESFEFNFHPSSLGLKKSIIMIFMSNDALIQNITGIGIQPDISVLSKIIDFGEVLVGTSKDTVEILLRNDCDSILYISASINFGPDTLQFSLLEGGAPFDLEPGEERELKLGFSPVRIGRTSGNIHFHYKGKWSPAEVRLFGEGIIAPMISLINSVGFENPVCENTPTDTLIELTNYGNDDLIVISAKISGKNPMDFYLPDGFIEMRLEPDSSSFIKARFDPQTPGRKEALLELKSNAHNAVDSLTIIKLFGIKDVSEFSLSDELIEFTDVPAGTPASASVTIINSGTVPIKWNPPISSGRFSVESVSPIVTPPDGGLSIAEIIFSGGGSGEFFMETIEFVDSCGNANPLRLTASVLKDKEPKVYAVSELDFPDIICTDEPETIAVEIKNIGCDPLYVSSAEIFGQDSGDFRLSEPFPGRAIESDSSFALEIVFAPASIGVKTAELQLRSNAVNVVDSLTKVILSGRKEIMSFELSTNELIFPASKANTASDSSFTIVNTGSTSLAWVFPVELTPFTINDVVPPTTPPDAGISTVYILFQGGSAGSDHESSYTFEDSCGNAATIRFYAEVREKTAIPALLWFPHLTAAVGDLNFKLPLMGKLLRDTIITNMSFKAEVKFNATSFLPKGSFVDNRIVDGERILNIKGVVARLDSSTSKLAEIPGTVLLSNCSVTPLDISSFQPGADHILNINIMPGSLVALICKQELSRIKLFTMTQMEIRPNPADDEIEMVVVSEEDGRFLVEISSYAGRKLKTIIIPNAADAAKHTATISLSGMPTGLYYITLKTQSNVITAPLIIVK